MPSIQHKLLRIVLTATLSALLPCALGLFGYEVLAYRRAVVDDLRSQADLLAQSLAPTLSFDDPRAARDALASLGSRANVTEAVVFDAHGASFARYPAGAPMTSHSLQPRVEVGWFDGQVTYPVHHGDDVLGTLYLRSRHDLLQRSLNYAWILALGMAAGLVVAGLTFRRLHPQITRPVLDVARAARRVIEQRDYGVRVPVTSDDEVGVLVSAFNLMLEDLSQEMRERREAEAALRSADRRKDEFLAVLAHELRNPLAPLSNGLALLRIRGDDPDVRQRAQAMMTRQLAHMVRMIDDLLDVSRITRGKVALHLQPLDLGPLVQGALEAVEPAMQQHRHTVQVDLPEGPVTVQGDPTRLVQVLMNLLANAAKFTPDEGRITVALRCDGRDAVVTVQDNGRGLSPEHLGSIFEMFVQVDTSLERGAAGLGIGLTIAHQLVALHGGTLSVASRGLGQGATFTVRLPLAPAWASF